VCTSVSHSPRNRPLNVSDTRDFSPISAKATSSWSSHSSNPNCSEIMLINPVIISLPFCGGDTDVEALCVVFFEVGASCFSGLEFLTSGWSAIPFIEAVAFNSEWWAAPLKGGRSLLSRDCGMAWELVPATKPTISSSYNTWTPPTIVLPGPGCILTWLR
jgi:hypothetical protein